MADADAIWAARSDEELLEASEELSAFTEEGERIIRAELQKRGLAQPAPPIARCARCHRSIAANVVGDECSQCGEPFPQHILRLREGQPPETVLVPVLRTGDAGLILLAKSILEGEEIEYLVRGENVQDLFGVGRLGGHNYVTGPTEFLVHAGEAERARTLLEALASPGVSSADSNDDA
jgi:hypothetical protein